MTKTWINGSRAALAGTLAMVLLGAACCANGDNALQQQYAQAYGDATASPARSDYWYFDRSSQTPDRGTSDLLGDVTGVLTNTVDAATGTLTSALDPLAPVADSLPTLASLVVVRWDGAMLTVTAPSPLDKATAYMPNGDKKDYGLDGQPGVTKPTDPRFRDYSYLAIRLKDGSKWYFDRSGTPLSDGYKPAITISVSSATVLAGATLQITTSDALDKITVFYSNGQKSDQDPKSGRVTAKAGMAISYIQATLKSDGSKWYFDNAGNPLRWGYCPVVKLAIGASAIAIASSTDAIDELRIFFTDGSIKAFGVGGAFTGSFQLDKGKVIDHLGIRLKSDGSKWYFDNSGNFVLPCEGKWYTDMD